MRDEDFDGFNKKGLCKLCKEPRTKKGHDPCIANLPGVLFACCGHGLEDGYIKFTDGRGIRFYLTEVDLDCPKNYWAEKPVPMHIRGDTYTKLDIRTGKKKNRTCTGMPIATKGEKLIKNVKIKKGD